MTRLIATGDLATGTVCSAVVLPAMANRGLQILVIDLENISFFSTGSK
jgi:hypothetical protein